jgi:hypothetical protein
MRADGPLTLQIAHFAAVVLTGFTSPSGYCGASRMAKAKRGIPLMSGFFRTILWEEK